MQGGSNFFDFVAVLAKSVTNDDDVGNTVLSFTVEADEYIGMRIERISTSVEGAPVLVTASRRSIAAGLLERLELIEQ